MTRTEFPGGTYVDATPGGAFVVGYLGSVRTHLGTLTPLPDGEDFFLFLRCTDTNGFKLAGKDHLGSGIHTYSPAEAARVHAERQALQPDVPVAPNPLDGWQAQSPIPGGNNPVIYDNQGVLHITDGTIGSQGYRFCDETNRLWTGDETYYDAESDLSEWSAYGSLKIGQGHSEGGVIVWDGTDRRVLDTGNCTFVRVQGEGDHVAISYWRPAEKMAVIVHATLAELRALPVVAPPIVVGPTTPPRAADGRVYDLGAFFATDPALQPRSGPSHPQHRVDGPDGLFSFVKFGNPQAYETWALDANWVYHLEDASGNPPSSFSDQRWFPRYLPIGEAHAFVTGPHELIVRDRATCAVLRRDPINRKHWLHAIYDGWDWGPDLGTRPTAMLVYDNTAGIHAPDRIVEVIYLAVGADWCRWEAYRSDLVYAHGPAQFPDSARTARSDFYRVGPPPVLPTFTGCVPQVCPHYPPPGVPPAPPLPEGDLLTMFATIDPTKIVVAYAVKPSSQTGCYNLLIDAAGTVFSAHGDTRAPGTDGPWEQFQPTGVGVYTAWADGKAWPYGVVLIDKLPK